uniref:Cation channel complex component UNC80 N-terminal domain-containing protein n=1 Tax=Hucho hucho TaxID=62062 RepID=A0A4W5KPE2_9TELE
SYCVFTAAPPRRCVINHSAVPRCRCSEGGAETIYISLCYLYHRRHLQPFYTSRTESCREASLHLERPDPATAGPRQVDKMVKRKSLDETDTECGKGIPFPIQTFLWRQTSAFLRPKLGKQYEASCV